MSGGGDMTPRELREWGGGGRPLPPELRPISGNVQVDVSDLPPRPGAPISVFGTSFDRALPRVLSLGVPAQAHNPEDEEAPFPPGDTDGAFMRSFMCGLRGDSQWNAGVSQFRPFAAAVLTYGSGASSHRVWFDWRPGHYNVPPCASIDLQVIPYGQFPMEGAGPIYTFAASCSPGSLPDAHVPTVTGVSEVPTYSWLRVPSRARTLEIYGGFDGSSQSAVGVTAYQDNGGHIMRRPAEGLYYPPGPMDVEPGQVNLQTSSDSSAVVIVKFFLAL